MKRSSRTPAPKTTIDLDRQPTGEAEGQDFENADDRARRQHEINLLKEKKGFLGRLTGSTNEQLNTGLFLFLLTLAGLIATHVVSTSFSISDRNLENALLNILLAIAGYVLGSGSRSSN